MEAGPGGAPAKQAGSAPSPRCNVTNSSVVHAHPMLALSPFAPSYAPAFVARPVAVRSSAVMNHGMPPVYYDHDQEVHAHAPAMRPRFCMHNNPTLTLPFSRDDRASGTGREGTRRAWTAGLGRIGCERPCSGLLPSRSPHLALGLHLLPRAPATRTRNSWRIALSAPHTRRRGPSSTTTTMRCAPATVGSS